MGERASDLQIRVEPHYFDATDMTAPIVNILVDGENRISMGGSFVGFDPAEILDSGALIPSSVPRRVAVYRCSCSIPGCGVAAPVISQLVDEILWSDFQDFTGEFDAPITEDEIEGGRHLEIADIVFDKTQYLAEVERAALDRSWETPARKTARILRTLIDRDAARLKTHGLVCEWVFPSHSRADTFTVSFADSDHEYVTGPTRQLLVSLSTSGANPEDQAKVLAQELLSTLPKEWARTFPHERFSRT